MSNLAERISALSPEQRALLEKQLQAKRQKSLAALQPITRNRQSDSCPLSLEQEHLWFLDQLEPNSYAYNLGQSYQLVGSLNVPALERCFNEVIRRHEALRTTFVSTDGRPRQLIAPSLRLTIPTIDLTGIAEPEQAVKGLITRYSQTPFDLSTGPMIRAVLFKLSDAEHRLFMSLHHIVTDRWSFALLWRELMILYDAFSKGLPSPLPELPVQFPDFALWQREWLEGEVLEKRLSYWKKQLAGASFVLDLPTDRPRPANQTFIGKRQYRIQNKELWTRLKALCHEQNTTLFMTLLAAYYVLLYRYTGQRDIVVGTPYANRNRVETEGIIGYLLNMLVLRMELSSDQPFLELLRRVREMSTEAYANNELPFAKLIEELQPERDLSRNPLFQVTFVFVDFPEPVVNLPDLSLNQVDLDMGSSIVDLMLGIRDQAEPILIFEYNVDLFDDATITRMMIHYETLLESIVTDPLQRLSALSIIPDEERIKLLAEWNETSRTYPRDRCAHELFELQVERTPDATAVVCEDQKLSYAALNARANRLARELRARGVGPDVLVGILMERSIEMVIALLGILKAGGGYVPLDPSYPKERLDFIINDAGVSLVLTQELCVAWSEIATHRSENLRNAASPENIAYVIYTSGSTGHPKGVQVCQRSLTNCLSSIQQEPGLYATDVVLAITNLSFDIATLELLLPLITGAQLIVGARALALDGEQLAVKLDEAAVTVMQATPATWRLLIDSGWKGRAGLKVLSGGEALGRELADALAMRAAEVWNLYGPSETTIYSTGTKVVQGAGTVTIGRGIANTRLYVLDAEQNVLPIGCPGELYIGGEGVASGYARRPELTAEKFIPDPFTSEAGARLYRTGDLVRHLADGRLEFLGRTDHQVKLRGHRIELGEIEAVLAEHAEVRACVVVAREDVPGDKRLVAYVVAEPNASIDVWRQHLKQKLPEYMMPSSFVLLDQLPLTPNGKLDRRALPVPDRAGRAEVREFIAPRTPVEEILAGIWREILRVNEIGIYDSFFELGGHSLLGTQVISRVRDAFQIDLPLRRLFEGPTINELAACVEAALRSGESKATLPVQRVPRDEDLPLSFAQQRLWLLDKLEPDNPSYNMATAVRLRGEFQVEALEQALGEMVARHESLRTNFAMRAGAPVQVISEAQPLLVPLLDLSALDGPTRDADLNRAIKEEAQQPFTLASGSLLRVKAIHLGNEEHVLLITMHHIISDAWSLEIFVREMARFYEACVKGEPALLPELPVQYADYAAAQSRWLDGEVLDAQLSYWKKQLGGALPVLDLPLDHVRPPVQTFRGERRSLSLSTGTTEDLKALSRRKGATTFMTLLSAFKVLLHFYSGQKDIIIGTPIAGRNHAEIESLIGCFLNTLVLRTDLSGNPSFTELLGRVKDVALGAYAHQELPFELLLEELQPERDLSRTPLFQVIFNLLNVPESQIELAGLVLETISTPEAAAKFDLTVYAFEQEGTLRFTFVYNADLFEGTTIAQMLEHFQLLLAAIARNPEQPLATLLRDLKAATWQPARQLSIVRAAETFVEFPRTEIEQSIAARFNRQVQQQGDSTAVKTKQHEWSYRELDQRASRIAHTLLTQHGTGEARVALLLDHDAPMIAAMLGVLKAGKTYVPLDPAYPRSRTEYMLSDSQAAAIVTDDQNLGLARELAAIPIVNIDDLGADAPNVTLSVAPDAIAYLLYTSGSTGQPKGVMQNHRNVLHHIRTYTNALRLSRADKLLLLASYSFDAAVMDIYGALLNGAGLYPVNLRSEGFSGLASWLNEEQVTVYHSTPTVYRYFMGTLKDEERLESVRLLVLGGEEARQQDVADFRSHFRKDSVLVNGLGPTESTLAFQYFLDHETELLRPSVPIGYPVADTEARLVDEAGEEVLGYGPGEIEITSEHLARGYWMRPELTEAAFKDDEAPGRRRYRTGDVARRLSDGSLEYLGRMDHQVKVRGIRVELGEIEAELMRSEGVSAAVVVAHEAQRGEKQLACYVTTTENGQKPTERDLRSYLKERLPDYMVPGSFVVLAELPLTPNGKVDRRALPVPQPSAYTQTKQFVAPRTPVQEILAGIWREILRVEEVGIHDNFFELGGHSLLATQVISRARDAFQIELPLRRLFEGPTINELAASVEGASRSGQLSASLPVMRVPRDADLPVSFAQQRLWLLDKLEPNNPSYNMASAVRLRGSFEAEALVHALNQLVARHESLRTNFVLRGGAPVQVVAEPAPLPLEMLDVSELDESTRQVELNRLMKEEVERPFVLASGWLLRVKTIRLASEEHVVLITMHHIISDAWSLEIFVRELAQLYEACVKGETALLPELPVQYADYAVAQRGWLSGAMLEGQLGYWKKQLGGELPVLELPLDRVRPPVRTYRGERRTLSLSRETTGDLKRLSRREGATMFMTLLSAFKVLLRYYTAQDEIIVGTPIAGRKQVEIESLIGCFLNTLVLRTELRGDPAFTELLCRVKEVALGAYAHQDVPFELLLEELQPARDLSRTPLFQVMFNLLNVTESEIKLPGLVLEPMGTPDAGAKFDLTVYAFEKEEQFQFAFVYNSDLFEGTTITRMVECFEVLLAAIARHPEWSVSLLVNELPVRNVDRPNGVVEQREPLEYVAPSTPAEKIVAEVWAEVLGVERVGRNDNFFEIGGHSLLATQVITRVQETFEVEMPLRSLFEHPTLAQFVIAIEAKVVESVEALTEEEALALL